jgi:hypothetical protein
MGNRSPAAGNGRCFTDIFPGGRSLPAARHGSTPKT